MSKKKEARYFYGTSDSIEAELLVSPENLMTGPHALDITHITAQACLVWSIAALFYAYQFLLRVSFGVLKDDLMREFDLTAGELGSLSAFFLYAYAGLQIPLGILMDRYGPRRMISLSCLCCASGAILFGCAENLLMAQVARVMIGAGAACGFMGAFKVGASWFPAHQLGLVGGLGIAAGTIGALAGKAPLSYWVDTYTWRTTLIGIGLVGLGLSALIYAVVRDRPPHAPAPVIHTAQINFFSEIAKVIANPQVWLIALYGGCMYITIVIFGDLWGEAYLMTSFNVDKTSAAAAISMLFVGVGIGGPIFTHLSDRRKNRKFPMTLAALGTAGLLLVLFYFPKGHFWTVFPLLFMIGFMSSGKVLSFTAATEHSSRDLSGTVVGFTNMVCMLSGALFQPLIGYLLDLNWNDEMADGVRIYSFSAYQWALSTVPGLTLLSILLIVFVKESHVHAKSKSLRLK